MGELTKRAGIDLRDNIPVACKFLKDKFHSQLHEKNNETMEEYKNLMNQSHENIVDFYGITYHVNFGYAIVTGYLPLKDIEKFVAEENKNTIRKADIVNWLKDIARGMTYIHEKNMIHRDLAARNVLLEEIPDREKIEHDSLNTRAKITDFGLARPLNSEMEYQIYSGPPLPIRSVAPECLTSTHFSKENDIWAFGCIIWELLHRNEKKYPECKNINELQQFLITEGKRLKFKEEDTSANYKKLVEVATNCFCKEPRIRGSFDQILSNLEQIDYEEDEILYQPSHHTHLKY
uniref:Non-specific protein-tyrosine kinase n=1 Tax=Rhabditophanes sp. KR3021 TaxID=114890 RepID=A0AC35U5H4_9BILA